MASYFTGGAVTLRRLGSGVSAAALLLLGAGCGGGSSGGEPSPGVTGTRIDTYWQDDGTTLRWPNVPAGTTVSALLPEAGGYRELPGTIGADGHFAIPGVGSGTYFLKLSVPGEAVRFYETTAHVLDLGVIRSGRPDAAVARTASSLGLQLTGLRPWVSGDELVLYSTGAQLALSPASPPSVGSTEATVPFSLVGQRLPAAGDVGWILQRSSATASPSGAPYRVVTRHATLQALATMSDGDAITVGPVPLAPPGATGTIGVDLRASEFAAALSEAGGRSTVPRSTSVSVRAAPRQPFGSPFVTLLRAPSTSAAADTDFGTLAYPRFLPPWFDEYRYVESSFDVTYSGIAASNWGFLSAWVDRVDGSDPVVRPTLGPVQSPLIAGRDLHQPQSGVGLTPMLSWSPPALGSPTGYTVTVVDVTTLDVKTVAFFVTTRLALELPPGLLEAGKTYLPFVYSFREPGFDPAAPVRAGVPRASVARAGAPFSP